MKRAAPLKPREGKAYFNNTSDMQMRLEVQSHVHHTNQLK